MYVTNTFIVNQVTPPVTYNSQFKHKLRFTCRRGVQTELITEQTHVQYGNLSLSPTKAVELQPSLIIAQQCFEIYNYGHHQSRQNVSPIIYTFDAHANFKIAIAIKAAALK